MLFHLEEAGLRYIPQKNGFREVESTGPPRPRCAKMGLKRPKSQPSTTAVHVHTSQATAPQTVVVSQPASAVGVVTMNNATEAHTERVCLPEQQQTVPISNSIQGSVSLDAQAILMPAKDETHQIIRSESQNNMMYQLESGVNGACGNENKTAGSSSEAEITTVSAQKSLDGSIDTADSNLKRETFAMDTEAELSSEKVIESKSSQSADTTVVPTATAITEEQSVQSTVKTTEEPSSSPQGQEMGNITDQQEQTVSNKPDSPKPSSEQQLDNNELLTHADSISSAAETSQYTEVAKSGPPLGNDSGTAKSSNDSNTAKAEADINTDSNTATESSNISSSKSEEIRKSSENPEEKTSDTNVEESSGESSISGIKEVIKQQQQQQHSLVPYENEDSSSSNEATTAQNGAQASTVESTSSSKEFSEADEKSEVKAQKQDEAIGSDIVTEDQPGENNQSDETKADVDKGAINSEGKNSEEETLPEESNVNKNSENLEAPKDETVQNVTAHEEESYDSNDRTQDSETIAGDAIKQRQQVERTESQSSMEGSEVKIAIDAECANGQVTAETKLASSEQLTGDNSTQPAIFRTENQMSENKPQVNAEMVENTNSRPAESGLLLTTGVLKGQGNASDTTGERTSSTSHVQTLTREVDTEVTPVVNDHQSEQVSLALLVFFSEFFFNFSKTSIDSIFHPLTEEYKNDVLRLITVTWCFFGNAALLGVVGGFVIVYD